MTPDPADKLGADQFNPGNDKLEEALRWARKGFPLTSTEGKLLAAEIDRLRALSADSTGVV